MTTSRRTILQGAAWAAPAVLATATIPAYAASSSTSVFVQGSPETFNFQNSDSTNPTKFTGRVRQQSFANGSNGFGFYTTDGSQATVTLTGLTYYLLIPRSADYTIDSVSTNYGVAATTWDAIQPAAEGTVTLANGNVASAADYYIFSSVYNAVPVETTAASQDASTTVKSTTVATDIAGAFTSPDGPVQASGINGVLTGYVANYVVSGGVSTTSSTVTAATKAA
ncbi:hypothetical protein [Rothia nasisuis]|uniref:hypothetical protein n=1 Tax=Rothia nasisuis TaxID=2109647 RepID=UPI001F1B6DBD|nr:hypothetical protein [Rothia nasisuis]